MSSIVNYHCNNIDEFKIVFTKVTDDGEYYVNLFNILQFIYQYCALLFQIKFSQKYKYFPNINSLEIELNRF